MLYGECSFFCVLVFKRVLIIYVDGESCFSLEIDWIVGDDFRWC